MNNFDKSINNVEQADTVYELSPKYFSMLSDAIKCIMANDLSAVRKIEILLSSFPKKFIDIPLFMIEDTIYKHFDGIDKDIYKSIGEICDNYDSNGFPCIDDDLKPRRIAPTKPTIMNDSFTREFIIDAMGGYEDDTNDNAIDEEETDMKNLMYVGDEELETKEDQTVDDEPNNRIEVTTIDDPNEFFKVETHEGDVRILSERFDGSRIERLKEYKKSFKYGRKIFLPDSGYDVYVKKMVDKDSINHIHSLTRKYPKMDIVDIYIKEELIRSVYDNIEFYFDQRPDYKEFMSCISQRDFTLLSIMFALVNCDDEHMDNPTIEVSDCRCAKCDTVYGFSKPRVIDLQKVFSDMYPIGDYLKRYDKYLENKPKTITAAYRAKGYYGELVKIDDKDMQLRYEIIVSRPTMYKTNTVKKVHEDIVYSVIKEDIRKNSENLRDTVKNFDDVEYILDKYTSYRDLRIDVSERIIEDENYDLNAFKIITDMMDGADDKLFAYFEFMRWVDLIRITPHINGEDRGEPMVIDHSDAIELFDVILDLRTECIKTLVNTISDKLGGGDEMSTIDLNHDIDIKGEAGLFSYDATHISQEDAIQRFKDSLKESGRNATEDEINQFLAIRRKNIDDLENKGICYSCGHDKFVIDYVRILFFAMSRRLEITGSHI